MQDLTTTPLCQINHIEKHTKFFTGIVDCPRCGSIKEICKCKKVKKVAKEAKSEA